MKKFLILIFLIIIALPVTAKEYYNEEYGCSLVIPDYYEEENPEHFSDEEHIVIAMTDPNDGTNLMLKIQPTDEEEVTANEIIILRNNLKQLMDAKGLIPYANGIIPVKPNHMGMFFRCHSSLGIDHLFFQYCAHKLIYTLECIQPTERNKDEEFINIINSIICHNH